MTPYENLFTCWGTRSEEGRVEIRGYYLRPDKLTADWVSRCDESAARTIQECQDAIDALTEYRRKLAERYATLQTAPYKLRLELERHRAYRGSVTYYVRIVRTYEDGTTVRELTEEYPGKERHTARARFEALKKERPGIECFVDIEKGRWER